MKRTNEPGAGAGYRVGLWAMVCFLLGAAGLVYANENQTAENQPARTLLRRMAEAARSTDYIGVYVHRVRDSLQTMYIVHQIKDGHRRERLLTLSGPAREVIRTSSRTTYIEPTTHSIADRLPILDTPFAAVFSGSSTRAFDHFYDVYDLKLLGNGGRIAGREARRLNIVSLDQFRYGYRLWIDEKSGLLLRSDLIDELGEPLEQTLFTTIETRETIADQRLEPTLAGNEVTWQREYAPPAKTTASVWEVGDLPEGFQLVFRERHRVRGDNGGSVEHRLYSDGLATVSVYIRHRNSHPFNGWSRVGAVSAFGRTLGGYQIIVVGEVPPVTVRHIGQSVRRVAKP
ncbi:MAG: MucB/RseB C-terminal domain-containing protein [Nitrococcus sp.]|nr:MucB/RseB C-terminal domain-containing protein [Nitrococcus sp.]